MAGAGDLLGPVGAFGKMPSQGDFFWLDLPTGFAAVWDDWLNRTLGVARSDLGERWQECYYSAPIWRFSLRPQVAGQHAVHGVLMPSVDRVGRAFPLTLVVPVAPRWATAEGHMAQAEAFTVLEHVALDALEFSCTPTTLRQRLDLVRNRAVAAEDLLAPPVPGAFRTEGATCWWSALSGGDMKYLATGTLPTARQLVTMLDLGDRHWAAEAAA